MQILKSLFNPKPIKIFIQTVAMLIQLHYIFINYKYLPRTNINEIKLKYRSISEYINNTYLLYIITK